VLKYSQILRCQYLLLLPSLENCGYPVCASKFEALPREEKKKSFRIVYYESFKNE